MPAVDEVSVGGIPFVLVHSTNEPPCSLSPRKLMVYKYQSHAPCYRRVQYIVFVSGNDTWLPTQQPFGFKALSLFSTVTGRPHSQTCWLFDRQTCHLEENGGQQSFVSDAHLGFILQQVFEGGIPSAGRHDPWIKRRIPRLCFGYFRLYSLPIQRLRTPVTRRPAMHTW